MNSRLWIYFLFLALVYRKASCYPLLPEKGSSLSHAMSSIVLKLFAGKNNNIRVTCSTSDESLNLLSDFLVELGDNIKVTLDEPNMIKRTSEKKISPTIIIIHSMQSFNSIADKLSYDNLRFREFYLLVLTRTAFALIDKVLSLFWSFWIHKISLMVEVESASSDGENCEEYLELCLKIST